MSLGEAFVEVHADLRPFAQDLRRNLRPIVEAFERDLGHNVGSTMLNRSEDDGRRIGDRLSRGMKNSLTHQFKNKNVFIAIASSLGSALDDGISALPTEVKAAIVLGILLAAPVIAAFLTGAIVGALGAGIAGAGVLLAAQFQEVRDAGTEFFRKWRKDFVEIASAFGPAVLLALSMIDARLTKLRGAFETIFDVGATFVAPLTEGILDAFEHIVNAIARGVGDIKPFVDELSAGFELLGLAIAEALRILIATGDDGVTALRDLLAIVSATIVAIALLLHIFTRLYGAVRLVVRAINELLGILAGLAPGIAVLAALFNAIDRRSNKNKSTITSNAELEGSFTGLIAATDGETKALKEMHDALEDASDAARNQLELNIDWQESLDRVAESLKENGRNLDINTEKGRDNAREFLRALEIAEKAAVARVQRGEQTAEQSALQYQKETEALRALARQAGIADSDFNKLYNEIITTAALRISAEEMGVTGLTGELSEAAARAKDLLELVRHLSKTVLGGALGGAKLPGYADGGIVNFPQIANVAESGPEVIIPLTRPSRAAQLLQQSGLSQILSSGPAQVLVFIGNEQLESRMVKVVERNNQSQSLALTHGGRSF